jgi:hypothetical protein
MTAMTLPLGESSTFVTARQYDGARAGASRRVRAGADAMADRARGLPA